MNEKGTGLGTATLKTRLDLTGLGKGIEEAKTDVKKFASSTQTELTKVETSVNDLGDATGLKELKQQMKDVQDRAKKLTEETKDLKTEQDKATESSNKLARAAKFLAGAYVVLEASKTVVAFLQDSAQAAAEADESYKTYTASTNLLTASQDNLKNAIGVGVTPALATLNVVFGTSLDMVANLIMGTGGVAKNTAAMGTNFTTAANDGKGLTQEMINIAVTSANIITRFQGVGQAAIGLSQVITAPFAALGAYVGTTLAQLELSVSAIKSLSSFDFASFNADSQAIAEIEKAKKGIIEDALVNAFNTGIDNLAGGFNKVFNANELSQDLQDSILTGMTDALALSTYQTDLETQSATAVKTGVVKGLESEEVSNAISVAIAPLVETNVKRISLSSDFTGGTNPTVNAVDSIPTAPAITQPVLNGFGGNNTSGLPLSAPSPFSPVTFLERPLSPVGFNPVDLINSYFADPAFQSPQLNLSGGIPSTAVTQDADREALSSNLSRDISVGLTPLVEVIRSVSVVPFSPVTRGGVNVTTSGSIDVTPDISVSDPFRPSLRRGRLTGQAAINDQAARAQLQRSLTAAPNATRDRIKAETEAARIQAQSAEDFALTIVNAGAQFGNAVLSFSQGNIGSGIGQLGAGIGSIVGAANPIAGAAIGVGSGLLGGFVDLFTGQDEQAKERAKAASARSVPAVHIVTNINQTNTASFSGISDPRFQQNSNRLVSDIVTAIESNIIPRIEKIEGALS